MASITSLGLQLLVRKQNPLNHQHERSWFLVSRSVSHSAWGLECIKLAKIGTVSLIRPLGIVSVPAGIEGAAARLGTGAPEAFDGLKQRLAPDADVENGESTIQAVPLSPHGLLVALVGIAVTIGLAYGAAVGLEAIANFSPIRQFRWLRAVVAAGVSIGSASFAGIGLAYLVRWR